ncbi:MAG TPA: hypothetical protein VMH87_08965 [Pseudomonadales bacterium]|nr:hypothetical protein [Pseudomonadales bacterium]
MARKDRPSVRGQTDADIHAHGRITRGVVTEEMVEGRARELALIAGREPNRVTGSDRIQAKKELLGDDSGDAAVDDTGIMPGGMGSPPTSQGRKTEPQLPTDDETATQMVQEGLDEAEHDKMLRAAKNHTKSEG